MKKIIHVLLIFFTFLFSQEDTLKKQVREKNYKSYFVASEVFLGLTSYSWLLPLGLGLKDRLAVAVGLWTPAISLFISSRVRYVKESGTPLQVLFGGIGGVWRGLILNPSNIKNPFTLPLMLSLTENFSGYLLSENLKFGVEDAWRFFNFNCLGIFHAGMIQVLTEEWKGYKYLYPLLSSGEGYLFTSLLAKEENISFGDAFVELEYARLGITSPLAFYGGCDLLFKTKFYKSKLPFITALIGSCGGYYFGYKLSQKRDLSFGEALLVSFAPRMIEGLIIGTALLVFKFDSKGWGISLLALSVADPIGTYLFDKKLSKNF